MFPSMKATNQRIGEVKFNEKLFLITFFKFLYIFGNGLLRKKKKKLEIICPFCPKQLHFMRISWTIGFYFLTTYEYLITINQKYIYLVV